MNAPAHVLRRFHAAVRQSLRRVEALDGAVVVVGLSGGADSVALLRALLALAPELNLRLMAAHLNHCLRGAESERDEDFVRRLCARLGVTLMVERADELLAIRANLEERARERRYRFLERVAEQAGARFIALAHHADDQAETVLMRLMRGAGIAGLSAMAEQGPGRLLRPLLGLARRQIQEYLDALGQDFVEDSSNLLEHHDRNRVRGTIIPFLERQLSPRLREHLSSLAGEMRQVDDFMQMQAEQALAQCLTPAQTLDLGRFGALHPGLAVLVMRRLVALRRGDLRGVGRAHLEAAMALATAGPPNGTLDLGHGWRIVRCYGTLAVERVDSLAEPGNDFEVSLEPGQRAWVAQAGAWFGAELIERPPADRRPEACEAWFDAGELGSEVSVRNYRAGDRIEPLGLGGRRKVKDILIEHKVPRPERAHFPVVVARHHLLWLPGLVRSNFALITGDTSQVLRLSVSGATLRMI